MCDYEYLSENPTEQPIHTWLKEAISRMRGTEGMTMQTIDQIVAHANWGMEAEEKIEAMDKRMEAVYEKMRTMDERMREADRRIREVEKNMYEAGQ